MTGTQIANSSGGCGCSPKAPVAPETSIAATSCCGGSTAGKASDSKQERDEAPAKRDTAIDPVCGMTVGTTASKHRFEYIGETYHFCSAGCRTKFAASPESYSSDAQTTGGGCCGGASAHDAHGRQAHDHKMSVGTGKMVDPVCGMTVDPETSEYKLQQDGETHYFCSAGCQTKFAADPQRYLNNSHTVAKQAPMADGTIYTCPMHPQIRQVGPGSCPICGMALEPELFSFDDRPNPELADMTRRFWIGLALATPAIVLEMGGHLVGHGLVDPTLSNWIQFVFATPSSFGRAGPSSSEAGNRW